MVAPGEVSLSDPILDAVLGAWRLSVIATACRLGVFSSSTAEG